MKSHAQRPNRALVHLSFSGKFSLRNAFAFAALITVFATLGGLSGCAGVTSAALGTKADVTDPPASVGILTPSLTTVAFGSILMNTTETLPVTLTNSGTASVTISAASASGTGYSINGLSAGQVIGVGQSAAFNAVFAPTVAGSPAGTITITSNASVSPLSIVLGGTATQTQAELQIGPTSVSFPTVAVGVSSPQTITLTNTGNASLTISAASASGTGYKISGLSTPLTIAAGQNTNFTATFTPTAGGTFPGSITISSNAPNSPSTVALTGIGTQPLVSANPSSASLGTVVVGSSNTQSILLTNTGNATLTFSQVTVTGGASGFSLTGLSTSTAIAAGGSVTFDAAFTPTSATSGTVSGSIVLGTNGSPAQLTIPLSGAGIAATTQLGASPTTLAFGNVSLDASTQLSTTITNTGNSNVTISGVTSSGAGFSASGVSNGLTLQPNQTATLTVTFDPMSTGTVPSASVTVTSNAGGLLISLSGTGVQSSVLLSWVASTSSDVTGYYAYRSTTPGSGYVKLNPSSPVAGEQYTDTTVQAGQTYYYVVTAVDSSDVESAYSTAATAVIP
jgi:Abnormal spindle-like microcephaly-assoc'd, ASPM-SPD-2-Hydin